jgi:hypothetical protein
VVLSSPRPTIELARIASELGEKLGRRARVSTLHDMVVVDVDRERLVEVATLLRDGAICIRSTQASIPDPSSARSRS